MNGYLWQNVEANSSDRWACEGDDGKGRGWGLVFNGNEFTGVFATCLACGWLQQWVVSQELLSVLSITLIIDGEVYVALLDAVCCLSAQWLHCLV